MAAQEIKKRLPYLGLVVVTLLSISNLFTFSDRIASKPNQAGFWMIFACGLCFGAWISAFVIAVAKSKK
jgi:hypothetical protein